MKISKLMFLFTIWVGGGGGGNQKGLLASRVIFSSTSHNSWKDKLMKIDPTRTHRAHMQQARADPTAAGLQINPAASVLQSFIRITNNQDQLTNSKLKN